MSHESDLLDLFAKSLSPLGMNIILWAAIIATCILPALILVRITIFLKREISSILTDTQHVLRDRYDDFALSHNFMMDLEAFAGNLTRKLYFVYLKLRWNRVTDEISRAKRRLGFLFDHIMGNIWWQALLFLPLVMVLDYAVRSIGVIDVPIRFVGKESVYFHVPRKWAGSNSLDQPAPTRPDQVAYSYGMSDDAYEGESLVSTPQVVTVTETRRLGPATITVPEDMSRQATVSSGFETLIKASTTGHTGDKQELPLLDHAHPEQEMADGGNGVTWCKLCEQMHCCELPI
ncbi:hypothetical protein Tdes44962_MAKER05704 [Teratosphaeria destructans]|uniref:Uncharacterized protein n=1 Tax=Teratosphaeria destructans TaxID=418781 RepID=A0A9W7SJ56_9PEZI|nr:hypothetical protein Tdes44962_MAKER05704 [Teratosphaeria destructans]